MTLDPAQLRSIAPVVIQRSVPAKKRSGNL